MGLTNQMAVLTTGLAETERCCHGPTPTSPQLNKDYALLQNRFLRDVAERLVLARGSTPWPK